MKEFLVLFGAGAEYGYKLPSGAKYTKDTILTKNTTLYEHLEKYYKNRTDENYSGNYRKEYLFRPDSHAFCELIENAARTLKDQLSKSEIVISEDDNSMLFVDLLDDKKITKEFKEKVESSFEQLTYNDNNPNKTTFFTALENTYSYYGTVEKDFSCIINPKKAGTVRFWRLVNYFWSAFFSILIPIVGNSDKYSEKAFVTREVDGKRVRNVDYLYLLNNLSEILKYIYTNEFIDNYTVDKKDDYYFQLKEKLPPKYVATLNYTPFVKRIGLSNDKIAFLAGELATFERPTELEVFNAVDEHISEKDFVFPFLMTQAPLKPIVASYQLREYNKFLNYLEEGNIDTIVIIGFSLGESDNHVNALLHEAVKNGKKILYCHYAKDGKDYDRDKTKQDICNSIHISGDYSKNVTVVQNNGDISKLIETLRLELG